MYIPFIMFKVKTTMRFIIMIIIVHAVKRVWEKFSLVLRPFADEKALGTHRLCMRQDILLFQKNIRQTDSIRGTNHNVIIY